MKDEQLFEYPNPLKLLRESHDYMSQEDAGKLCGVTRSAWCNWELKPDKIGANVMKKIAKAFKCNCIIRGKDGRISFR